MPSLVLGKVRKFQPRSPSRFGDIPEKPEGWMKTPPPLPLIGLSSDYSSFNPPRLQEHDAGKLNGVPLISQKLLPLIS